MERFKHFLSLCFGLFLITASHGLVAQSDRMMDDAMMDNGMMMSGWAMLVCVVFGVLLFVALILSILALLKYLFGKKD